MRVPYQTAISFATDHGAFARLTVEGLLIVTEHCTHEAAFIEFCGDVWFEETHVFDVDDDGKVDSNLVRVFIGY